MNRFARFVLPIAVLAGALTGASQQRPGRPAKNTEILQPAEANPRTQAIQNNNLGIAFMNRRQFDLALGKFQTACILDPSSDVGCLNMGIAMLNLQHYDEAGKILAKSSERDPENPRSWFNLGLLERDTGHPDAAIDDFSKAAALDPNDTGAQYFIGLLFFDKQQYDKAIQVWEKVVKLDPFHAPAELGLAQAKEKTGDAEGSLAHLNRFKYVTSRNLGKPMSFTYGEQGKYSLAEQMTVDLEPAPPAIPVHYENVTILSGLAARSPAAVYKLVRSKRAGRKSNGRNRKNKAGETRGSAAAAVKIPDHSLASFLGSGACILDDGGKQMIFLVNAVGDGRSAMYRYSGAGKFVDVTRATKLDLHGQGTGCAVGDYDNDGHPDLAVSIDGHVALYRNHGDGTFWDVTDAAKIHMDGLALGLTFVDYDQDGHLDLYVTRFVDFPLPHSKEPFTFPQDAAAPGNILWRNNGDGTFMDWTKQMALSGNVPSIGAVGSDVSGEHGIDFVVTGWNKAPAVFMKQTDAPYRATEPWAAKMPGPTAGVVPLDFNHDGLMDLAFTHWSPPGMSLWRNKGGEQFERVNLPDPGWMRGWGIAALDYDNDGWVDLVAVGETFSGEGRIALFRNEGANGFRDVTRETGLDKIVLHDPRSVIALDYDGDGSPDLLITQNNLPPVLLKNVGSNKNNWLQLVLEGEHDSRAGIGTGADIFAGVQRQTWQVAGASGYLGQGPSRILVGLGTQRVVDVIRLFWPTGLAQDEIQILADRPVVLTETDRCRRGAIAPRGGCTDTGTGSVSTRR